MLGMTIALRLAQQGKQVTVLEAAGHLGGLADAWSLAEWTWDRHYHVTLKSDLHLRSLLKELGFGNELKWTETRTGFYTDGKFYSMSNILEFLRFPPLSLLDRLRLGATIFYASRIKDWRKLERTPVADWLQRWSGTHTFEKIWLPLLRAKLGEGYRKTSAAFIWATIARMYAARRTGLKKEMFGYVDGGYARIVEQFIEVLRKSGVRIRFCCPVKEVCSPDGIGVNVKFASGQSETFDQVVLTIPAPAVMKVCPLLSQDEKAGLSGVEYQGIVCASLLLKRPLSNFYITNLTDPSLPFTAVIEMTALVDRSRFGGNSLVYLPKYVSAHDAEFSRPDHEIQERFLSALENIYPHFHRDGLLCFRVSRAPYVFALSTLNYSAHLPAQTTSIPGVHVVNSAQIVNSTLNVNETVRLAEQAACALNVNSKQAELSHGNVPRESGETHSQLVVGPG
jgi:protoporphyrinogen oxidase